jgi:hypothetical protein
VKQLLSAGVNRNARAKFSGDKEKNTALEVAKRQLTNRLKVRALIATRCVRTCPS